MPWEIQDALPLARAFHDENQTGSTFSEDAMWAFWNHHQWAAFGLFDNDKLVGVLLGFVSPHFMTTDKLAQENMWFIKPDYRGTPWSAMMFVRFEEWAKSVGATALCMASLPSSPDSVDKLYAKNGYTLAGKHFLKFI